MFRQQRFIVKKKPSRHAEHLRIFLKHRERESVVRQAVYCEFSQPKLQFLGRVVGRHDVTMEPARTAVSSDWPVPSDDIT